MSISANIISLEAAAKLRRYTPRTRRSAQRRLYLAGPASKDLTDPQSAVNLLVGRGYVEAALTRWAVGDLVYGDKRKGRFLARLDPPPPEIWEIRVTDPVVQARLLGRFAEPDTFILTKFYTRQLLGDYGSSAWNSAMTECQATWNQVFGGIPPFAATSIHDYVTENCDDFPI
jgi:hypothetical protein